MTREKFDKLEWRFESHMSGETCCLTESTTIPGLLRFTLEDRCKWNPFEYENRRMIYSYNGTDYADIDELINALIDELRKRTTAKKRI